MSSLCQCHKKDEACIACTIDKLITFCKDSANEFGTGPDRDFEDMTVEELTSWADWYDYLWDK